MKMPCSPVSSRAKNATVPLLLREPPYKNSNGPLVSTMVVVGPPLPVKMPCSPVSRKATNATVPLSLREGLPKAWKLNSLLSAIVVGGAAVSGEEPCPTRVQGGEERHRTIVV